MANKPEEPNSSTPPHSHSHVQAPKPTKLQLSRYEREQRTRKIVVIGAAIVGALTLILVVAAVLQILVFEPRRTVATVGTQAITSSQLQQRMRFNQQQVESRYRDLAGAIQQIQQQSAGGDQSNGFLLQFYQQQLQQLNSQLGASQIANSTLDTMIDDQLIRQEAAKRGIVISADDVQQNIESSQGFYRVPLTPFPTYTPVPPSATPTATSPATSTSTPTAAPTATRAPTNTPAATATATAASTIAATALTTGTTTVSATATVTAASTITATAVTTSTTSATAAVTATIAATATSAPSATATTPATATSAPSATQAATATSLPSATATITPTQPIIEPSPTQRLQPTTISQDDFKIKFDRLLGNYTSINYTEADFRGIVESSLYRDKLTEAIGKEVKTDAPHYQFDYIRFNTENDAKFGLAQLNEKKLSFQALISQTNTITQPASPGFGSSLTDWTSAPSIEQQYGNTVLAQLEGGALNTPSGVISGTNGGFYIVLPKAREVRPLSDSELSSTKRKAFDDFLAKGRADANLVKKEIDPTTLIPDDVAKNAIAFQQLIGTGQ